jgi:recombination protein RecA
VKVVKNKVAPPFREVEFDILYGEGISHEGDLVDLGAEAGVVEKSGAWFGFEGERIGQGRENAKAFLREHPDMARKIEGKLLAHHGVKRDLGAPALASGAPANGAASAGPAPASGAGGSSANAPNGATVHTLAAGAKPGEKKR